jgi:hypothetical protein
VPGTFILSLDFEIHWGVSDHRSIESYYENLTNVPAVVRRSLKLFKEREIHATWATVGMLFCRDKEELFTYTAPGNRPSYDNVRLSNYLVAEQAGNNEGDDPYHYAISLVREIIQTPHQEMATHTYSHYYCLEPGQTPEQFYHDLGAAKQIAAREQVQLRSIVFPRNQYNDEYLFQCRKQGITCYRGNYPSWIYRPQAKSRESKWKRLARFTDSYFPLSGSRYVSPSSENGMVNIPGSCFLRPYQPKLSALEPLRLARIKKEMTAAARKEKIYHLWWHPHNFGRNMDNNFSILEKLLDHYSVLRKKYGMQNFSMAEMNDLISLSK